MILALSNANGSWLEGSVNAGAILVSLIALTLVNLLFVGGILYTFYYFLTLPMRRNERARLFLDLVELGLNDGDTPEKTITSVAASRDISVGVRFHALAAHLQKGLKLSEALEKVPRLLPPQLVSMLKTGERIGNLAKVLPACRQLLNDGVSQVRGALNYLLALTLLILPSTVFVPLILNVMVLPKFREVFQGMMPGNQLPAFTQLVFGSSRTVLFFQIVVMLFVWALMLAYIGGPRLQRWIQRILPGVPDRIQYRLPWRRKRLQRDFSAMLAVLLDSEVPEAEAIALAAESTNNRIIRRRATNVIAQLNRGVKLPAALREMDDSGELQWRLANALQRGSGFLRTLTGWHGALDARAFQLEQTAAQVTTSALVLFNGAVVASVAIAIFLALIDLVNEVALW